MRESAGLLSYSTSARSLARAFWGTVHDVQDPELHQRYAEDLFARTGFDLRGQVFKPFYAADITGASAVEVADGHMDVTIWKAGEAERVVRKH